MKKIILSIVILMSANFIQAQKIANTKWYEFYLGGTKGFYTKTHTVTPKKLTENQTGSGGAFDNKPTDIAIEKIVATTTDERIINKYDDTMFMVIVFKNIDVDKATVCINTEMFKTVDEALAYSPAENDYATWYTEAGFKKENAKPVMPAMTKDDMIAVSKFIVEKLKEADSKLETKNLSEDDREFALAMSVIAVPFLYAESKGYHAYKSLGYFEKGIKKYKNDASVKKIFKDGGFADILKDN